MEIFKTRINRNPKNDDAHINGYEKIESIEDIPNKYIHIFNELGVCIGTDNIDFTETDLYVDLDNIAFIKENHKLYKQVLKLIRIQKLNKLSETFL